MQNFIHYGTLANCHKTTPILMLKEKLPQALNADWVNGK